MTQPLPAPDASASLLPLPDMANAIRALSMDAVQAANSGHPGMPMGMADAATALWATALRHHPEVPHWPDRDRFVLSAGHGSMLLYSLLYLTGYSDITLDEIKRFRQLGSKTCGHPEYGVAAGIETTTGPLGQGLANAVGMALAEAHMAARFGAQLVDHYTYCIVGDGCLMEGISQEAASFAAHLKLRKLVVLFDDNGISIDGPTSLSTSEDQVARFKALGWHVLAVDGHDIAAVSRAIDAARASDMPSFIACKTTIAYGAPTKAGTSASHGSPLGAEEIAGTRAALGWEHAPFEVPEALLQAWRSTTQAGAQAYHDWCARLEALPEATRTEFTRLMSGEFPGGWVEAMSELKTRWLAEPKKEATRASSGAVLAALTPKLPELVGGSADLTGSNLTKTGDLTPLNAEHYDGRYVYYGIREHAMGAVMNGMCLHGGILPYSGTFLVFSDYMRSAMRLSALMGLGVIYVLTHDSIGVGEDGPTHQPVEHLATLRVMPNLYLYRPADRIETLECWALSIASRNAPSALALTRQNVPQLRVSADEWPGGENKSARGGYILRGGGAEDRAVIIASGSEVSLAMEAAEALAARGIAVRVVSLPCMELFFEQPASYRAQVLGNGLPRIAVEAASSFGWHRIIGDDGRSVCLERFGESGPGEEVFAHLGITTQAVIRAVEDALG